MAKKENKSVFTAEFALKTDKHQERKLNLKFDGMTSLYNQLLKFLLKQHEKLKKDSASKYILSFKRSNNLNKECHNKKC